VLSLGNLEYTEDGGVSGTEEGSAVSNKDVLTKAAALLDLNEEELDTALISRKMGARSIIFVPLKVPQAMAARDALAKVCYGLLFGWLIRMINKALDRANDSGGSTRGHTSIGVLDIFGFEIFEVNSFEQLCINYCNEKLQFYFNNHIFVVEQEQYIKEGVTLDGIEFKNNGATCDLIEGPGGIIATLDEELKVPKGSDPSFMAKLLKAQGADGRGSSSKDKQQLIKKAVKATKPSFIVVHFAGDVEYDVAGFMDKTRDELPAGLQALIDVPTKAPKISLMRGAGAAGGASGGAEGPLQAFVLRLYASQKAADLAVAEKQGLSVDDSKSSKPGRRKPGSKAGAAKASIGKQFKGQLGSLMLTLGACSPHFVRCMKSNSKKAAGVFESPMMIHQLRCSGLLEVCRVRQMGFPDRIPHVGFVQAYWMLAPDHHSKGVEKMCEAMEAKGFLKGKGPRKENKLVARKDGRVRPGEEGPWYAIGKSKVFMRCGQYRELQQTKERVQHAMSLVLQRIGRMVATRLRYIHWKTCLRELNLAVEQLDSAALDEKIGLVEAALPYGGGSLPLMRRAVALRAVLKKQQAVIDALTNGSGEQDEATLKQVVDEVVEGLRSVGLDRAAIDKARSTIMELIRRKRATVTLSTAMKGGSTSASGISNTGEKALKTALPEAEGAGVDPKLVEEAKQLLRVLREREKCAAEVEAAMEGEGDRLQLAALLKLPVLQLALGEEVSSMQVQGNAGKGGTKEAELPALKYMTTSFTISVQPSVPRKKEHALRVAATAMLRKLEEKHAKACADQLAKEKLAYEKVAQAVGVITELVERAEQAMEHRFVTATTTIEDGIGHLSIGSSNCDSPTNLSRTRSDAKMVGAAAEAEAIDQALHGHSPHGGLVRSRSDAQLVDEEEDAAIDADELDIGDESRKNSEAVSAVLDFREIGSDAWSVEAEELLELVQEMKAAEEHMLGALKFAQTEAELPASDAKIAEALELQSELRGRRLEVHEAQKRVQAKAEQTLKEEENAALALQTSNALKDAMRAKSLDQLRKLIKDVTDAGISEHQVPELGPARALARELLAAEKNCLSELKEALRLRDLDVLQGSLAKAAELQLTRRKGKGVQNTFNKARAMCKQLETEVAREVATRKVTFVERGSVDLAGVDIDKELWSIFTFYTVNTYAREPDVMRKDALVQVLRDCNLLALAKRAGKLMVAEVNVIHQCELSLHKERKFKFSSFRHGLEQVAKKVCSHEKDDSKALKRLLSAHVMPHCKYRIRSPLPRFLGAQNSGAHQGFATLAAQENGSGTQRAAFTRERGVGKKEWKTVKHMAGPIFATFDPPMKKVFIQYGTAPTNAERKRGRHTPRVDIPAQHQTLTYNGFCSLCADFKLSVGTKMFQRPVKSADLAAVFLDSLEGGVIRTDTMGGLEYEEFWQAFVRLVLRLSESEKAHDEADDSLSLSNSGKKKKHAASKKPGTKRMGMDEARKLASAPSSPSLSSSTGRDLSSAPSSSSASRSRANSSHLYITYSIGKMTNMAIDELAKTWGKPERKLFQQLLGTAFVWMSNNVDIHSHRGSVNRGAVGGSSRSAEAELAIRQLQNLAADLKKKEPEVGTRSRSFTNMLDDLRRGSTGSTPGSLESAGAQLLLDDSDDEAAVLSSSEEDDEEVTQHGRGSKMPVDLVTGKVLISKAKSSGLEPVEEASELPKKGQRRGSFAKKCRHPKCIKKTRDPSGYCALHQNSLKAKKEPSFKWNAHGGNEGSDGSDSTDGSSDSDGEYDGPKDPYVEARTSKSALKKKERQRKRTEMYASHGMMIGGIDGIESLMNGGGGVGAAAGGVAAAAAARYSSASSSSSVMGGGGNVQAEMCLLWQVFLYYSLESVVESEDEQRASKRQGKFFSPPTPDTMTESAWLRLLLDCGVIDVHTDRGAVSVATPARRTVRLGACPDWPMGDSQFFFPVPVRVSLAAAAATYHRVCDSVEDHGVMGMGDASGEMSARSGAGRKKRSVMLWKRTFAGMVQSKRKGSLLEIHAEAKAVTAAAAARAKARGGAADEAKDPNAKLGMARFMQDFNVGFDTRSARAELEEQKQMERKHRNKAHRLPFSAFQTALIQLAVDATGGGAGEEAAYSILLSEYILAHGRQHQHTLVTTPTLFTRGPYDSFGPALYKLFMCYSSGLSFDTKTPCVRYLSFCRLLSDCGLEPGTHLRLSQRKPGSSSTSSVSSIRGEATLHDFELTTEMIANAFGDSLPAPFRQGAEASAAAAAAAAGAEEGGLTFFAFWQALLRLSLAMMPLEVGAEMSNAEERRWKYDLLAVGRTFIEAAEVEQAAEQFQKQAEAEAKAEAGGSAKLAKQNSKNGRGSLGSGPAGGRTRAISRSTIAQHHDLDLGLHREIDGDSGKKKGNARESTAVQKVAMAKRMIHAARTTMLDRLTPLQMIEERGDHERIETRCLALLEHMILMSHSSSATASPASGGISSSAVPLSKLLTKRPKAWTDAVGELRMRLTGTEAVAQTACRNGGASVLAWRLTTSDGSSSGSGNSVSGGGSGSGNSVSGGGSGSGNSVSGGGGGSGSGKSKSGPAKGPRNGVSPPGARASPDRNAKQQPKKEAPKETKKAPVEAKKETKEEKEAREKAEREERRRRKISKERHNHRLVTKTSAPAETAVSGTAADAAASTPEMDDQKMLFQATMREDIAALEKLLKRGSVDLGAKNKAGVTCVVSQSS
jgi:hypothetical protein